MKYRNLDVLLYELVIPADKQLDWYVARNKMARIFDSLACHMVL